MMKYKIILFFVFISQTGFSQNEKIEKFSLLDTLLVSTIKDYIVKRKQEYAEFNKFGYIEVRLLYFKINDKLKFGINDQYYRPNKKHQRLPKYYCYIEDKLVLFYNSSQIYLPSMYSKKNQRKIDRISRPYLNKRIHLKARDKNGKIIINDRNFRDESFNIHGGIILSIFNNGTFEIK